MDELRPGWKRVKFGEVVRHVKDKVDPAKSGLQRYVAGEHMDTDELRIRRWGEIGDGYLGPAFHMRFEPGQVLYGSRRTYLRKVAVADFGGICANTTFVLESADGQTLLPELLPFIMQTETFHEHSKRESKGSVNPYVNFSDLAWYEFALPPLDEQRRIAAFLRCLSESAMVTCDAARKAAELYRSASLQDFDPSMRDTAGAAWREIPLGELANADAPICYGIVQLGTITSSGIPVLRTQNLNGDYSKDLYFASTQVDHAYRRSRVRGGDILIAIQGMSTGKIGLVPDGFEGNINRHLARVRLDPRMRTDFFVHLWKSPYFSRYAESSSVGSTKPELTIGALKAMRIPCPPLSVQSDVATRLSSIQSAVAELEARANVARALLRTALSDSLGRVP